MIGIPVALYVCATLRTDEVLNALLKFLALHARKCIANRERRKVLADRLT
jgi:hypothetical protein